MMSCASPAAMPAGPHTARPQPWGQMMQAPTVKSEPMDEESYSRDQTSGFYSEGFHSASPSSSSKDSNGHSPASVGSGGEPSHFYDNVSLNAQANHGVLEMINSYRVGVPYNLLTPPGIENQPTNERQSSPGYNGAYSPRTPSTSLQLPPPTHVSTPLNRTDNNTPPKSPIPTTSSQNDHETRNDRSHDSGVEIASTSRKGRSSSEGGSGVSDVDEPGVKEPTVNSHGKLKTYKCKQCQFVAVTKLSFWEHSKSHIKPEKMLKCRQCPFVTEYKHHLEYHMRNHLGSKPFHCAKCSYSCVNKSMLNSHLKSHSNVYQFRCADCNYATKYCHSLKLHLRKYRHMPDMVLNADGTPNPYPIIDVYGTRRGPKQKPITARILEQQAAVNSNNNLPQLTSHHLYGNHLAALHYLPRTLQQSLIISPNNNFDQRTSPIQLEMVVDQRITPPGSILQHRLSYGERPVEAGPTTPPTRSSVSLPPTPRQSNDAVEDALDLTKTSEAGSPPPTAEKPLQSTPTTKNRRKGPAFKLQPAALRLQHEEAKTREADASGSESDAEVPSTSSSNIFACQYCDITFGDLTMHTIHMGFHGYNDPFMCNKCGERSADRVSFFIHLCRTQH